MPKDTADIVATANNPAAVVVTIDSGTATAAALGGTPLGVGDGQHITLPTGIISAGDSVIIVDLVFAPGDSDANIGVSSGPATPHNPPGTLPANTTPGFIDIFGE